MNNFTIKLFEKGEKATFYTIHYVDEVYSETDKFFEQYEATHVKAIDAILQILNRMLTKRGTEYSEFRPEGKNYIVALPRGQYELRLYGIWVNGRITVLGNGGIKNTRTFQEDAVLNKIVQDLNTINKLLTERISNQEVLLVNNELVGNLTFNLNDTEDE